MTTGDRWQRLMPYGVPLVIFALVVAHYAATSALALTSFPLDDAWIHRVYARSFALADGFAYNPGDQQAGATSPLWVIVTAPPHWLSGLGERTAVVGVKLIGVALTAGSLLLVVDLGRRLTSSLAAGAIAGSLLALDGRLGYAALSGMESPLLVFLALLALRELLAGRGVRAIVIAGLLPVTRPEAALLAPLVIAAALWSKQRDHRWPWALAAAATPSVIWAIYCKLATGRLLPTTFYVKAKSAGAGSLDSLGSGVIQHGLAATPLMAVGMVAVAALLWQRRDRVAGRVALLLLAAPAIYLVGVAVTRDLRLHGFYWTRYLDPGVALLAVAAAVGAGALAAGQWGRTGAIAGVVAMVGSAPWLLGSHLERVERLISDSRAIERINVDPARWLAANTAADAVIGVNDAGASRYFADRRIVDLVGLNDAEIAFDRPSPQRLVERLDWLAVFPHVATGSGLRRAFDRHHTIRIPQADYTVCDCPGQTSVWILHKPDGEPTSSRLARAFHLARSGDVAGATSLLDQAIAANPGDPEPYQRRAQLARMQDRDADAVADLERAVAVSADGPAQLAELGLLYAELGRTADAVAALKRSLAGFDDPRVREILRELGRGSGPPAGD